MKEINVIGFSHRYPKLHGQTTAKLIAVEPLTIDDRTPVELLDYDTSYDGGRFPLEHGEHVQLVFLGNLRIPFCTIRKRKPGKDVEDYEKKIGEVYRIKYKGEPLRLDGDQEKRVDKEKHHNEP